MLAAGDAHLPLIRPRADDPDLQAAVKTITGLLPQVEPGVVEDLISGEDFRERLVGLVLAAKAGAGSYVPAMVASLADPRGLAIVPTLAALACLPARAERTRSPFPNGF